MEQCLVAACLRTLPLGACHHGGARLQIVLSGKVETQISCWQGPGQTSTIAAQHTQCLAIWWTTL